MGDEARAHDACWPDGAGTTGDGNYESETVFRDPHGRCSSTHVATLLVWRRL